jgi:hypothetical protein
MSSLLRGIPSTCSAACAGRRPVTSPHQDDDIDLAAIAQTKLVDLDVAHGPLSVVGRASNALRESS